MSETKTNNQRPNPIVDKIAETEPETRKLSDRLRSLMNSIERKKSETAKKKQEFLAAKIVTETVDVSTVQPNENPAIEEAEETGINVETVEKINQYVERVFTEKPVVGNNRPTTNPTTAPVRNEVKRQGTATTATTSTTSTTSTTATTSTSSAFKKKPLLPEKKKPVDDKRRLNKKAKITKGYEQGQNSLEYDEISGEIMKVRARRSGDKKKLNVPAAAIVINHAVLSSDSVSVKTLSERIGKTSAEIIKKLFLGLGIIKTINDNIDFDTAELISAEFGITLELQMEQTSEEKLYAFHSDDNDEQEGNLTSRPPIVTIMGHVDHGKTSILDYIRKANVVSGEAGGITQHIGAYSIKVPYEGEERSITFLDTPGHEAFTSMRARGANVTDIIVIVVAADDGIMPQTIEAINHAKAAKTPIIVAINKMDKPEAKPDRILQQLSDHGLLVEEWYGDVPAVRVSAKSGMGIPDLLNNILTVADYNEFKANSERSAKGTIIEAKLDKGKGPVATVLVQNGTLYTGDFIVAGTAVGRIRAMFDDKGKAVSIAPPSTPVSILGLQDVPNAGDQIMVVKDEKLSKQVVEERKNREKVEKLKTKKVTLEDVFNQIKEGQFKDLNLIVKADVQGSVEAVRQSLLRLSNDEVKVHIVHGGVGAINESDITLADTTNAIIIGFNIRPDNNAKNLAEKCGVEVKLYRVIYDAINDVTLAIKGMLAPVFHEVYLGRAEVRQIFRISSIGTIAGCMVKDGKLNRSAKIRVIRDGVVITETSIDSLKRIKDDVKEVNTGYDCGVGLTNFNDLKELDILEAFIMEEIK